MGREILVRDAGRTEVQSVQWNSRGLELGPGERRRVDWTGLGRMDEEGPEVMGFTPRHSRGLVPAVAGFHGATGIKARSEWRGRMMNHRLQKAQIQNSETSV
jgi:hypothetical protein